ncbi:MAG: Ig-like domain-containing protein [Pseudomonadota bacterium]
MRTNASGKSTTGSIGSATASRPSATAGDLYTSTAYRLLESRIAFDGATAATAADATHDTPGPAPAADAAPDAVPDTTAESTGGELADAVAESAQQSPAQHSDAIVFVDSAVRDLALIAAAAPAGAEIVLLEGNSDGLAQIASYLSNRSGIAAIHIVGHGETGEIRLGNAVLSAASASGEHADELAVIGAALTERGDILIYGCDVAAAGDGEALLDALANATGADVAASDDDTGHAALGGDWDLEIRTGSIEAGLIDAPEWNGLLSSTNTGSWSIAGSTATTSTSGITTTATFTANSANSAFGSIANGTFNAIPVFSNAAEEDSSLSFVFTWDNSPEPATGIPQPQAATDGGMGTITITFSQAVTNPVINLDRLGGNSFIDLNTLVSGDEESRSNSALWTLMTPAATLTELSGTSHFDVTATTIQRTPNELMANSGTSFESGTNSLTNTAAGSVRVNGTFTTLSFQLTGVGVEGAGADSIEIGFVLDAAPNAQNDAFSVDEDATLAGNLYADNGSGADSDPQGDTLTITQINGTTYTVGAPIVLTNGTLTITNATTGAFAFLPNSNFNGTQSFNYTISDSDGATDTATATITVNAVNDAPVDGDETNSVTQDTTLTVADGAAGDLLLNATDVDGGAPTITAFSVAGESGPFTVGTPYSISSVGTLSIDANGSYSFAPAANYTGAIPVVTYTVSDGNGGTDTSTLTLSMVAVNGPPVAMDDALSVLENGPPATDDVTPGTPGQDADPDGDPLTVVAVNGVSANVGTSVTGSGGGTFTVQPDGSCGFDPGTAFDDLAVGESRVTTVSYTISDGHGGTDVATVTVTVTGVNDAPTSTPLADQSGSDADPVTLDVSASFTDPDATDTLTFTAAGLPPGLAIDPATGVIAGTIDHAASVTGPYTVTVTATDPSGATTAQTFAWTVTNPAPNAIADHTSTRENLPVTLDVLSNDSDADGDRIRLVSASSSEGAVRVRPNGTLVFTPRPGYAGQATVTYRISDGDGGFASARVLIDVEAEAPALGAGTPSVPESIGPPSGAMARLEWRGAVLAAVESATGELVAGTLGASAADIEGGTHRTGHGIGHGTIDGDPISVEQSFAPGFAFGQGYRDARYANDERIRPKSGFSIRFGNIAGEADVFSVESLVRSESILVKLEPVSREVADRIVGYRFTRLDGTQPPSWLDEIGQGVLVGQVPANVEALQLRVIAVMEDGSEQHIDVVIHTRTGEIQRIAGGKRAELPVMFSEQLPADRALSLDDIEALGAMLRKTA